MLAILFALRIISFFALLIGMFALRIVEKRVTSIANAHSDYIYGCLIGFSALLMLAYTPSFVNSASAILLISGISFPLVRALSTIIVNDSTTNKVRSTVHSFLDQAEYLGEIVCGTVIGLLASEYGLTSALVGCAVLLGITGFVVAGSRAKSL